MRIVLKSGVLKYHNYCTNKRTHTFDYSTLITNQLVDTNKNFIGPLAQLVERPSVFESWPRQSDDKKNWKLPVSRLAFGNWVYWKDWLARCLDTVTG